MPVAIHPEDRRLLLIGGACFLLLLMAVALLTPSGGGINGGTVPSSYSTTPGGARAAYLLLEDLGYPVERWENSPTELTGDPARTVLVLADPSEAPNQAEVEALMRFVERGGRILFTGPSAKFFFPQAHPYIQSATRRLESFPAVAPSIFTRNAPTVVFAPEAYWNEGDGVEIPLYGTARRPVAVSWRIGSGYVLWWAAPTPLTNAQISNQGNLNLLLNAVGANGPVSNGPAKIYWDEYFHGERASLWSYISGTPAAWGLAQLGLVAAAVFLTFGRRSGPIQPGAQASRLWPLEFVDTMGALYERAGAGSAAVEVVYRNFRTTVTRRLQLAPTISDSALAQAVETRLGWYRPELTRTLARASAALHGDKIAPSEALAIVQELEYCRQRVDFKRKPEEEKTRAWNT